MPTLSLWRIAAVAVPATLVASIAVADDSAATTREQQLEQRIDDLERQLADVNRKLADTGASKAGDELEQRVAELEKLAKKDDGGMFGQWKNTTWLSNADGSTKIRIGGRIQNDWSWFWGATDVASKFYQLTGVPGDHPIKDGTEFRRARVQVCGTLYGNVDFMGEYDFAGGVTKLRDVNISLNCSCLPRITVGHMKEPFGLEELTSDLFTNFMERHSASDAFAPSYNTGIQLSDTCMENKVNWAVGMFRDAADSGNDTGNSRSGDVNYTARVSGRPWVNADGDQFLHVGAAGSYREPSDNGVRFSSRPELHLAPAVVDTGTMAADRVRMWELEGAYEMRSFHAEAEYYHTDVDGTAGSPDSVFTGWALQGGYFLTGEMRPYNTANGTWGRVMPKHNFDCAGSGMGAWEVVARWDFINLNDGPIDGGKMRTLSLGVNWYLNPNTKVMLDWVHAHADPAGTLDGLEMRFQVDF